MPLPRKTRGRQRVEMKKMDKKSNRQVTFSKRRAGLFKKASELCTLCAAKVAVIVFSPGKKVFSFGHPSVEFVLDRFLGRSSGSPQQDSSGMGRLLEAHRDHSIQELNDKVTQSSLRLEMVKRRGEELERLRKANQPECWWESPVEELNGSQLEELTGALLDLRDRLRHNIALAMKKEEMMKHRAKNSAVQNMVIGGNNNLGLFGRPNNVSAPAVNFGAFGPYGGGGILVPIVGRGPYNVAPPVIDFHVMNHNMNMMKIPMMMPVVNNSFNGDGFMMVPPGPNDEYYNVPLPGQVPEYDDGHVVGGFQNLLFENDDYGPPTFMELPGESQNFAGAEYMYQNPFGYGFF